MTRRAGILSVAIASGLILVGGSLWAGPAPAAAPALAAGPARECHARRLKVRVWEPGAVAPSVSVNVPVVLVTAGLRIATMTGLLDRALDAARHEDGVRHGIRLRGADLAALWSSITRVAPLELVSIDDGAGGRVEIRVD